MPKPLANAPPAMVTWSRLPLVYACSGCSSAAQMANQLAVRLDRAMLAEMSCIVGVGGGVPSLVRTARSGRPIVALDGCALQCSRACLERVEVKTDLHITLSALGIRKRKHVDFDADEADHVLANEIVPRVQALRNPGTVE